MRVLVIEDEQRMLELLRLGLQEHGCAVMTAGDGETGLQLAALCEFDVVVLDIGLPDLDGQQVLSILRQRKSVSRVLMLTARDNEDDIIRGLEMGADDYMSKPFSFPELMARLQAITRAQRAVVNGTIAVGELTIDLAKRSVVRNKRVVDLSRSEFSLLVTLVRDAGRCVSRQQLTESIWGAGSEVGQGSLDVLINSLRGKIDAPFRDKLIRTIRGSGYVLACEPGSVHKQWKEVSI